MDNLDDVIRGLKQLTKTPLESVVAALEAAVPKLNHMDEIEAMVKNAQAAVVAEGVKLNSVKVDIAKAQAELASINEAKATSENQVAKLRETIADLKSKLSPLLA